jgi:hypothetical protein
MATVDIPAERRAPGKLFIGGDWVDAQSGATSAR